MRQPAPVRAGGHVRVISPSFPMLYLYPSSMARAERALIGLGLKVSYGTHAGNITDDGMSAGTPQQRAADFMEAFLDPTVDAVFSAYGGATAHELLPLLDPAKLRGESKAFIGNSDNVWLHQYLLQEAGLTSYYGATYLCEMGEFAESGGPFPETLESFREVVMSTDDVIFRPASRRSSDYNQHAQPEHPRTRSHAGDWQWLRPGRGQGPLLGAEVEVLGALAEHFDLKLDGCVLFWDLHFRAPDVDVAYRALIELANRAPLDRLAGMVVGPDVRHTLPGWVNVVADILATVVPHAKFPVLVGADIGHLDPKWVVPYGRTVVL